MTWTPRPDDLARAAAGEPPHPLGTELVAEGTVKYWKDDKGYGANQVSFRYVAKRIRRIEGAA